MANDTIQNYTFDELNVGMSARLTHKLTHDDVKLFAAASGDPVLRGLGGGRGPRARQARLPTRP